MDDSDFRTFEKLFEKAEVVSFSDNFNIDAKAKGIAGEAAEYLTARAKYFAVKLRKFI